MQFHAATHAEEMRSLPPQELRRDGSTMRSGAVPGERGSLSMGLLTTSTEIQAEEDTNTLALLEPYPKPKEHAEEIDAERPVKAVA